jgi:hypothetical protein
MSPEKFERELLDAMRSELPELQKRPLTRGEHNQVLECLNLIAPVQARGMTVIARAQRAAALLAPPPARAPTAVPRRRACRHRAGALCSQ